MSTTEFRGFPIEIRRAIIAAAIREQPAILGIEERLRRAYLSLVACA